MMKKIWFHFIIITIYALLIMGTVACTPKEKLTNTTSSLEEDLPIQVEFQYKPVKPKVNQPVQLTVYVSQKNSPVEDADAVKYEVWEKGQEKHEMITAKKSGVGLYSIPYTFHKEGSYYVIYHVDARGFHNMRKNEIAVNKDEN